MGKFVKESGLFLMTVLCFSTFAVVFALTLLMRAPLADALRDSAIACIVMGLVLRHVLESIIAMLPQLEEIKNRTVRDQERQNT